MDKHNSLISIIIISGLILAVFGLLVLYNFGELTCAIKVQKIDYIPDNFIVITEQDIQNYSTLKKAMETKKIVKGFCRETNKIHDLFNDRRFFEYEEEYYAISFYST
jgi:hypothetical protein